MIICKDLTFAYAPGAFIFKDAAFSAEQGEFVIIRGESGCGKTSFINLIGGLIRPNSGTIIADGMDLARANDMDLAQYRARIGFVFQDFMLDHKRTVLENVLLPLYFSDTSFTKGMKAAKELLEQLGIAELGKSRISQISGGQRRRAAIARALINSPMLLLADEPLAHLDPENAGIIAALLQKLHKERGLTILMSTHLSNIPGTRSVTVGSGKILDNNHES